VGITKAVGDGLGVFVTVGSRSSFSVVKGVAVARLVGLAVGLKGKSLGADNCTAACGSEPYILSVVDAANEGVLMPSTSLAGVTVAHNCHVGVGGRVAS
jgi:hypothetical protein